MVSWVTQVQTVVVAEKFRMVVEDVLHTKGRGTVLVGDLPTDSVFRSGEIVRVLRKNAPVLTSPAYVELHTRRGTTGLSLSAFDADVQPGDVVEAV